MLLNVKVTNREIGGTAEMLLRPELVHVSCCNIWQNLSQTLVQEDHLLKAK